MSCRILLASLPLLGSCLLSFSVQPAARAADDEAGFVSMFNGRDLTGWEGKPGWWYVEDGAITSQSTKDKPCNKCNYLMWRGGKPGDFELRLLVPHRRRQLGHPVPQPGAARLGHLRLPGRPGGRARIGRAPCSSMPAAASPCAVRRSSSTKRARSRSRRWATPPSCSSTSSPNDWNEYRVIARGPEITLEINGVVMAQATDRQTGKAAARRDHRAADAPRSADEDPVQEPADQAARTDDPTSTTTLIVIATYNEIENLPALAEEIFRYAPEADLLVIDDNSPDGTGRWCDERAAAEPRLHVLHRAGKLGLGTALLAGMQYALDHDYAYVLVMDADFSHQPKYLPALLGGMAGTAGEPPADVMIGSRYVPGGGVEGWPWRRKFMSRAINWYARLLLRLTPRDCSGGYRCYRTAVLRQIDLTAIRSRGYSFQEEILWRLKRAGARCRETPIVFIDRQRGQSKINLREAFGALWILFRLGLSR